VRNLALDDLDHARDRADVERSGAWLLWLREFRSHFRWRLRKTFEQFNRNRAPFGGKVVEMIAIVMGPQGIAQGLEGRGIPQRIEQGKGFGRFGEPSETDEAINREFESVVGLGMARAPFGHPGQDRNPVLRKNRAYFDECVS
jgi:hypothetical protein